MALQSTVLLWTLAQVTKYAFSAHVTTRIEVQQVQICHLCSIGSNLLLDCSGEESLEAGREAHRSGLEKEAGSWRPVCSLTPGREGTFRSLVSSSVVPKRWFAGSLWCDLPTQHKAFLALQCLASCRYLDPFLPSRRKSVIILLPHKIQDTSKLLDV